MLRLLSLFSVFLLVSSCTVQQMPFNTDLLLRFDIAEQELAQLEFTLSKELVLYRTKVIAEARTNRAGSLAVKSGEQLQRLVFRRGSTGKITHNSGDKIGVSFEGDADKFLLFGSGSIKGNYYLLAKQWQNGHGELQYNGQTWFTESGSGDVHLIVKATTRPVPSSKTTIVGGKKN